MKRRAYHTTRTPPLPATIVLLSFLPVTSLDANSATLPVCPSKPVHYQCVRI
ncbi:MAG: hypothetical protein Q7V17_07325 [Afipia sp.]|nr:hypothetical protein [Afipia sp.]